MDRNDIALRIRSKLLARAERLGLRADELDGSFDLVRSGLLDSLGFVELITELEQELGREVDLASALDRSGATTLAGITTLFTEA